MHTYTHTHIPLPFPAGSSKSAFEKHAAAIQTLLSLAVKFNVRDLCVKFGCIECIDVAQKIKKTYVADFAPERRRNIDCTKAVYTAAALSLAAKMLKAKGAKVRLNATALRTACACKPKELSTVMDLMQAVRLCVLRRIILWWCYCEREKCVRV